MIERRVSNGRDAVALAASVGYQTNLMVYGLGGCCFTDLARVGAPLTLSTLVTAAIIIPGAFG